MQPVVAEIGEEERREREAAETAELHERWTQDTIATHLMFIKGAEVIFQEYREIIVELASRLRERVDPSTGKVMVVLRKFVEEWMLRRLNSFVRFQIPAVTPAGREAARTWPESDKDRQVLEYARQIEAAREAERVRAAD